MSIQLIKFGGWQMDDTKFDSMFTLLIEIANMNKSILDILNGKIKEEPKKEVIEDKLVLIRKMAQNIIMEGRDADIKKLFADHGIKKLSELSSDKYEEFIRILGGM
jgi:hypothetical protein